MHTVYSSPITGLVVGSSMDTVAVTGSGSGVGVALGVYDVSDSWGDGAVAEIMALLDVWQSRFLHKLLLMLIFFSILLEMRFCYSNNYC